MTCLIDDIINKRKVNYVIYTLLLHYIHNIDTAHTYCIYMCSMPLTASSSPVSAHEPWERSAVHSE